MIEGDQDGPAGRRRPSCGAAAPARAQAVQGRLAWTSCRSRGRSSQGPTVASRAGSRVRATATETIGMRNPATPMLARNVTGRTTSARRLMPDRQPGEHHGPAGGAHGPGHRLVVVVAVGPLLPPAGHDEQRVVDGHAQADQGDQELHDDADRSEMGQAADDEEGRRDGNHGHEQRDDGDEAGEHEGQYGQGAEPTQRWSRSGR